MCAFGAPKQGKEKSDGCGIFFEGGRRGKKAEKEHWEEKNGERKRVKQGIRKPPKKEGAGKAAPFVSHPPCKQKYIGLSVSEGLQFKIT